MSFKFPVPNEEQSKLLKELGMQPRDFVVTYSDDDCFHVKHFKTGNELHFHPNVLKRRQG